jgi:hypothetical protein
MHTHTHNYLLSSLGSKAKMITLRTTTIIHISDGMLEWCGMDSDELQLNDDTAPEFFEILEKQSSILPSQDIRHEGCLGTLCAWTYERLRGMREGKGGPRKVNVGKENALPYEELGAITEAGTDLGPGHIDVVLLLLKVMMTRELLCVMMNENSCAWMERRQGGLKGAAGSS